MTTVAIADQRQARKVVVASLLGNTIEYYEYFIYGLSASLVFQTLFFPKFDPIVGTLLALSTFALAFVARPVGGWVFGHYGDRLGRRAMLMFTLTGMGCATTAIGLLPTYAAIGVAAPILLTLLRFAQGFSIGGETSGGFLITLEHTARERKGFFTGIVGTGNVWGLLLGNGVFLLITQLPEDRLLSWGWRIPFLLSAVLVVIAIYIRRQIEESPEFTAVKASGAVSASPSREVVRRHWKLIAGAAMSGMPVGMAFYMGSVFALSYGKTVGLDSSTILVVVMITCAGLILAMPFFGWLGDRLGRKRVFVGGLAVLTVAPFVWFPLLGTGNFAATLLGYIILFAGFAANYGVQGAFYPQLFPVGLRYSGMALSVNISGLLGGALAPIVATALLGAFHTWVAIAAYMSVAAILALIASAFLRERGDEPTAPADQALQDADESEVPPTALPL